VAEPCALCGETWGEWPEEVEGRRLNFCCDACAHAYRAIGATIRERLGWPRVERLFLEVLYGEEASGWAEAEGRRIEFDVEISFHGAEVVRFEVRSPAKSPGGATAPVSSS
jgi:hypothetical protein